MKNTEPPDKEPATPTTHKTEFHDSVQGPIHTGSGNINIHPTQLNWPFWLKKLDDWLGWSNAPEEVQAHFLKRFAWLVKKVYQAKPRFWRVMLTAVILLPLIWLFLLRPMIVTQLNVRGTAMIGAGEYTRASQTLERAVKLNPNDARTRYNLGNTYDLLSGNEAQAIVEFQTAIRLDDSFWPAYNNLARLYILTDDPQAALDMLRSGLDEESKLPEREMPIFQKNVGWAYLGQVDRQSCPFLANALVQAPQRATMERALTELEEAQAKMQAVRETGENVSIYLAEIYLLQGCVYEALGQPETARRVWSDSLAHASAVLGSEQCKTSAPLLFDCLRAKDWTEDIEDRLGG